MKCARPKGILPPRFCRHKDSRQFHRMFLYDADNVEGDVLLETRGVETTAVRLFYGCGKLGGIEYRRTGRINDRAQPGNDLFFLFKL
jgi:hypothetical protein